MGDDVAEDHRVGPPVGDNVVHGLNQSVVLGGQRHQRVPHQWWCREVERSRELFAGNVVETPASGGLVDCRRIDDLECDGYVGPDDLRDPAVPQLVEPGPKSLVSSHDGTQAGAQRLCVDRPRQLGDLLHAVGVGVVVVTRAERTVEVHALLQWQQRQDVLDGSGRLPPVQVRLGDVDQREVRRGVPGQGLAAGQRRQRGRPQCGEFGDVGGVKQSAGPGQREGQSRAVGAVLGDRVDLQCHCGIGGVDALAQATELGDRFPCPSASAGKAPEVVEEDLGCGPGDGSGRVEVTQHAVAKPPARRGAQLLLDRLHRRRQLLACREHVVPLDRSRIDAHRVDRGEPSDRAGQVEVPGHEFRLPAVTLQVHDRRRALAAPAVGSPPCQRQCERAEQHVVDSAVDRGGNRRQQCRADVRR